MSQLWRARERYNQVDSKQGHAVSSISAEIGKTFHAHFARSW
jgi:hypothetical protein